jgi:hypothetical protein
MPDQTRLWPRGVVVGASGCDRIAGMGEIAEERFIEKLVRASRR